MTAADVLDVARRAGLHLEAHGNQLRIRPARNLTPELREQLARHKDVLLATLAPSRHYVTLKPDRHTGFAPTLPVEAIELALDFERRGFRQFIDEQGEYAIEWTDGSACRTCERESCEGPDDPTCRPAVSPLSEADRAAIARWKLHLACIVSYEAPEIA